MKFPNLVLILTCKCEDASYIASESLDRRVTFSQRWARRLHDLVCRNCRRVTRQLRWLHRTLPLMPGDKRQQLLAQLTQLSPAARQRILTELQNASFKNGEPDSSGRYCAGGNDTCFGPDIKYGTTSEG